MDTHIGGYIVRQTQVEPPTRPVWHLILAATGETLRVYTDYQRATEDAKRYERLTVGLS